MNKKDYRSIPFWSWNDKLETTKLIEQIHWMNDSGIGGFFMHARSGLQTEYLSEEWMQCIEACADEAKKLDNELLKLLESNDVDFYFGKNDDELRERIIENTLLTLEYTK